MDRKQRQAAIDLLEKFQVRIGSSVVIKEGSYGIFREAQPYYGKVGKVSACSYENPDSNNREAIFVLMPDGKKLELLIDEVMPTGGARNPMVDIMRRLSREQ